MKHCDRCGSLDEAASYHVGPNDCMVADLCQVCFKDYVEWETNNPDCHELKRQQSELNLLECAMHGSGESPLLQRAITLNNTLFEGIQHVARQVRKWVNTNGL